MSDSSDSETEYHRKRRRELTRLRVQRLRLRRQLSAPYQVGKKGECEHNHVLDAGPSRSAPACRNDRNSGENADNISSGRDSSNDQNSDQNADNIDSCNDSSNDRYSSENADNNSSSGDNGNNNCDHSDDNNGDSHDDYSDDNRVGNIDEIEEFNEEEELRKWALTGKPPIPHTRLEGLLKILRRRLLPNLPKSARTFLFTDDAEYDIQDFDGDGAETKFVYFGLDHLYSSINTNLHNNNIELMFNADGVRLFKSRNTQFWPIMCKVFCTPNVYKPFPVLIWHGTGKPSSVDRYLTQFIDEINNLLRNGITIENRHFNIQIKAFICDWPARAFLKCIKSHGGFSACERCVVHGVREDNRTIYPETDCEARTNASFRSQSDAQHHKGISPLLRITPEIDMVLRFVLDCMHGMHLGVMKGMLQHWQSGDISRLSQNDQQRFAALLKRLEGQIPKEFHRTTKSLAEIDDYKATEFQLLLLYILPTILKYVVSEDVYNHFLLFHMGCRILHSETQAVTYCNQAKYYLKSFVTIAPRLYGRKFLVGNVHNLIHIADDVSQQRCCLPLISAFPFENALGQMVSLIRSGKKPLAQVCRRLHEIYFAEVTRPSIPPVLTITRELKPDIAGNKPIVHLTYRTAHFSTKSPNNVALLNDKTILEIKKMYVPANQSRANLRITGTVLNIKKSLFTYPCDSGEFEMWVVKRSIEKKNVLLSSTSKKMVLFDLSSENREKIVVMPLLHMS